MMIPIAACAIPIVALCLRHRERMAMIEHGIHPDLPKAGQEAKQIEERQRR